LIRNKNKDDNFLNNLNYMDEDDRINDKEFENEAEE
jgi:hypothetical protein